MMWMNRYVEFSRWWWTL